MYDVEGLKEVENFTNEKTGSKTFILENTGEKTVKGAKMVLTNLITNEGKQKLMLGPWKNGQRFEVEFKKVNNEPVFLDISPL